MKKTTEFLIGIAIAGVACIAVYILTRDKKTEVGETSVDDVVEKLDLKVTEIKEHISDIKEEVEDKIEDFVETADTKVEEARDKVEEVTKDVVNRISRELARANNYDIPPYEISHETYIQPMSDEWKKVTVFYDKGGFHGIYGEEYKPFVLGEENVENFAATNAKVMYIRNENLECDYAVYKGEEDGEN